MHTYFNSHFPSLNYLPHCPIVGLEHIFMGLMHSLSVHSHIIALAVVMSLCLSGVPVRL